MISASAAATLSEASLNETARLQWRAPKDRVPPPVTVVLLVVSGVTKEAGRRILGPAFDKAVNPLCALDVTSRCDAFNLRSTSPATSLPNWIAALTGASPSAHGVLGNVGLSSFPMDSIFARAAEHSLHAGISASPWFVSVAKDDLPLLDGDGRVSSSADGTYETTRAPSTLAQDTRRKAATLRAVAENVASVSIVDRPTISPSRYALFVSHLTNADTVAHRQGAGEPYEDALRGAAQFALDLMEALPSNSVMLLATDHGHEAQGGAGGTSPLVTKLPLYIYRKSVIYSAAPGEIDRLGAALSAVTGEAVVQAATAAASGIDVEGDATGGEPSATSLSAPVSDVRMVDLPSTMALLAGLPQPRHTEGVFIPQMFENVQRSMWPVACQDLVYQRYHYAAALLVLESLDTVGRLRSLDDLERDAMAKIGAGGGTPLDRAVVWLEIAAEIETGIRDAKATLVVRYALRNFAVTAALGILLVAVLFYILSVMTFADPVYVFTYRRYAHRPGHSFWKVPDVVALGWSLLIVAAYYFVTITVYMAVINGSYAYSAFDSSSVHDEHSHRRYLLITIFPGAFAQWALTRTFYIYYRKRHTPPPTTGRESILLLLLRWLVRIRVLLSSQVE